MDLLNRSTHFEGEMSKSQTTAAHRVLYAQYEEAADNNYELAHLKMKRNKSKKKPSGERPRNRSTPKWDVVKHGEVTRSLPNNAVLNRLVQSKRTSSNNKNGRASRGDEYKMRASHTRTATGEPKKSGTRSTYLPEHPPNSERANMEYEGKSNNAKTASRNASFISGATQSKRKDVSPLRDSSKRATTINAAEK